ncbi:Uncharacterized protein OBRU01_10558 [Operophtera brumata]|uniref:Uncharacterized protein n=1 Tax=Operophtera brumata TaxID=104452 RepID=A0A0L7LEY8_OPEBR|nr:Uncharacterized protein OBRU01_10558 [Operophtera brumata]
MPEDSKKNSDKKKHEPKEQRKPRHSRNQSGKTDKKAEKAEESKAPPKVTVPQKPVYEDPGPEFYKNLKRETDEIVKITEAENAKYKKKEIQSNWAKYEMPIETPSLYDKYFEINMDNLSTAISTVPFYQRNDIHQSEFSETDLLSMNNRASKYKLKYFNDKAYSTPETVAQERILKSLRENLSLKDKEDIDSTDNAITEERFDKYEVNLDFNVTKTDSVTSVHTDKQTKVDTKTIRNNTVDEFDDQFIFKDVPENKIVKPEGIIQKIASAEKRITPPKHSVVIEPSTASKVIINSSKVAEHKTMNEATLQEHSVASKVNPVIESPEDLEKWLDDFLDS